MPGVVRQGLRVTSSSGALAGVALVVLLGAGCGYRLTGTGAVNLFPEHVKALLVQPFENRTTRPEIEQRVTEGVARELSKRGRYEVVADRSVADAIVEGAITSYRTSPVEFGPDSLATRVEAVVTLEATVRELATDDILWSQQGLVFREQFDVDSSQGGYFDEESLALDSIARGAAGALVTSMLEGF